MSLADAEMFEIAHISASIRRSRWDGKLVKPTPSKADLAPVILENLRSKLDLDFKLYSAVLARFKTVLAKQDSTFASELATFRGIQSELTSACNTHPDEPACKWYALEDKQYMALIDAKGYPKEPVPFVLY
jgi:hypothetical protein